MKILKLKVNNFFLCKNDLNISFMPISKKTLEDKEYELLEIAPELYVYNSVAFIGKNASGKTTLLRLLNMVYEILSFFRIENFKYLISKTMTLELFFYHENKIYFYKTNILNQKGIVKFNEEFQYAIKYKDNIYFSDWDNNIKFNFVDFNLEKVYENIVKAITNIENNIEDIEGELEKQQDIIKIQNEINKLEIQIKKEQQFNRKVEINKRILELKNKMEKLNAK